MVPRARGISARGSISREKKAATASNRPRSAGPSGRRSAMSIWWKAASGTCLRARSTIEPDRSTPTTSSPASAICREVGRPVPHPRSSTRAPPGSAPVSHSTAVTWPSLCGKASSYRLPMASKASAWPDRSSGRSA